MSIKLGEVINRQCAKLMQRLHQIVPFPVNSMEVVRGLLPAGMSISESPDPRVKNLRLSVLRGDVVHIAIESESNWIRMNDGELPFTRVFWMKTPTEVPVPDAISHPYRLFEEHPHYDALSKWHAKANALNTEIETELDMLGKVVKNVDSAALLRHVWPELMSFVKLQGPTVMHIPKSVRDRYSDVWDVDRYTKLRPRVIEHLTSATLLEDTTINAWVDFKTI